MFLCNNSGICNRKLAPLHFDSCASHHGWHIHKCPIKKFSENVSEAILRRLKLLIHVVVDGFAWAFLSERGFLLLPDSITIRLYFVQKIVLVSPYLCLSDLCGNPACRCIAIPFLSCVVMGIHEFSQHEATRLVDTVIVADSCSPLFQLLSQSFNLLSTFKHFILPLVHELG